jgi:serine/threonine protein kinase
MSFCINPQCPQPENSDNLHFCVGCSSPLLLVNRYRVAKLMSDKGGFGYTYEMSRNGVAKVLKVLKSNDDMSIELFNREFTVLKHLNEQGVRGIPDVEDLFSYNHNGSSEPLYCLVMERIYGTNLEEYINRSNQPIDERTTLLWLSNLAQILKEIHAKQIFHRDIKHSNIILHPDGHQLVLIDFGAAKQAAYRVSKPGTRIFTTGYAAPEQEAKGQASAKSDFFSLGRTFVYLLTKEEPDSLSKNTSNQFRWRHLTNHISDDLLNLIDWLMEPDPDDRPENSDVILAELELLLEQNRQTVPPPVGRGNPSPPITRFTNPRKTLSGNGLNQSGRVITTQKNNQKKSFPFRKILLLLIAILVFFIALWLGSNRERFEGVTGIPNGEFKFGGSTTWATTRQEEVKLDDKIQKAFPQFRIRYIDNNNSPGVIKSIGKKDPCPIGPGSEAGICWLIEGDLDFAQSSMPLEQYNHPSNKESMKNLKEEAVGSDAVVIVVHPELNISALSKVQLRRIYTGEITNWKDIGGKDLSISPVFRDPSSGTGSLFRDLLLLKEKDIKAELVKTPTQGLQWVLKHPGAIFYGSAQEMIVDSCGTKPIAIGETQGSAIKPFEEPLQSFEACNNKGHKNKPNFEVIKNQKYPLTRKIYVIIKADGGNRQKAGEAYAKLLKTKQGQELLERAGFVSIVN